ncbi:MAG TPA: hypothetical protein VF060_08170 [Trebonia sp.]
MKSAPTCHSGSSDGGCGGVNRAARGPGRIEFRHQAGQAGGRRAEHVGELPTRHRAGERAERVSQRRERQAFGAEFDALAGQHPEAVVFGPLDEFPCQTGLAYSRLAADQRERRLTSSCLVQQRRQRRQFRPPPDEYRADHAPAHEQTVS